MLRFLPALLRAAACAGALALTSIGPAQAALWSGAWDPRYGVPFDANFDSDVLGWRGTALFEVPDECVAPGVVSSASCAGMRLVTAQVTFYDFMTDAAVETFNYTSADLSGFSVTIDGGGNLGSLTSDFFAPRQPTSDFSIINLYAFSLQFVEEGVRMYHTKDYDVFGIDVGPFSPEKCDASWWLRITQPYACGYSGTYSDGSTAPAVTVAFTRVPEPSSIALLFAAGFAGLVAARRRPRMAPR